MRSFFSVLGFTFFRRLALFFLLFAIGTIASIGQDLRYLPPVLPDRKFNDTATSFLFSNIDMRYWQDIGPQVYMNAVQIIDADVSWPPRWYTTVPLYTDSMARVDTAEGMVTLNYIFDARVEGENFCFFKATARGPRNAGKTIPGSGYIRLNKKMEPVDTIKSTRERLLYFHEFRTNDKGEMLLDAKNWANLDLRESTGDPKDTAVPSELDLFQVYDKNNKLVFNWNALDHMDPNVFDYKESLKRTFSTPGGDRIDWSHVTTANFDLDGNLLYSMRFIGIGKVSRQNGSLIWHFEWSQMPIVDGKDTIRIFSPHDLNPVGEDDSSNTYSVWSCGAMLDYPIAEAIVFKVHKKTHKITLVRRYRPEVNILSGGQGSFGLEKNGDYIMNYGQAPRDPNKLFRPFLQYGNGDSIYVKYSFPNYVCSYRVYKMKNWPRPPRPVIVVKNGKLKAVGEMKDWVWYKLTGPDNTVAVMVGSGPAITPEGRATYVVEGKYGIGYSVSLPFEYKSNVPY